MVKSRRLRRMQLPAFFDALHNSKVDLMHFLVLILLSLHVLSAVFWAGSTLVLRQGATPAAPLVKPLIGAAAGAIVSGAALWFLFHGGGAHGTADHVLGAGAAAAVVAAALQAFLVVPAARLTRSAVPADQARLEARMTRGQAFAAPLLMVALVCMVIARFV
jgi:hypothetical protein